MGSNQARTFVAQRLFSFVKIVVSHISCRTFITIFVAISRPNGSLASVLFSRNMLCLQDKFSK
jgi:hypothetical protein